MSIQDTAPAPSRAAAALFAGDGEMRARCRALDWAASPLGPVETWPPALRWAVRTALDSPFPINLWCGPELVLIYNDGYRHVLGAKHPAALGRAGSQVWAEIWPEIAPMFQQIAAGGPPIYAEDAPFVIERAPGEDHGAEPGQPNAWYTFALSPVRDEDGAIVAYLNVVSETTARIFAERQLEAERGRLAEIFERAPAFIATLRGPDHVFETTNPLYQQLIGHRDVIGRPVPQALPEVVDQGFIGLLDGVYTTGEPFVGTEVPILLQGTPGGEPAEHFLNFIYQPIRETDDTISGIFVHAVDVTEQVRARRSVEELESRLRLALESAEIGTWDYRPQTDRLTWDERCRRMFGLAPDAPVDWGVFIQGVHPDDRAQAEDAARRAMDPAVRSAYDVEYRVVPPGGDVRWLRASGRARFEGEGADRRAVRFTGTVIDVTERKQAEAERERLLREAETQRARLEQIFTEAPAVMALYTGPDHVVTMINPTWEQTVGKPGAIGRPFREVFPEFAGSGLFEQLDRTYETGDPFVNPEVNVPLERWGSGVLEDTYWNLVWRPLASPDPDRRDILVHAVEVTAQVRARREVEQKAEELARLARALETSNRELDQFAYVASHDLKAPLRGIANLSQWIEDDLADRFTDDTREQMRLLRGRVHRMEGLIDGILQYSRAGRTQDPPQRIDTDALAHEIVDLLAPPAEAEVVVEPGLPVLVTERLPLQQVLMNLVSNGLKYGGDRPRVHVSAARAGDEWTFTVRDNGPGIAPEYHERIFAIFQTLQARDTVESTGIGLSIVKKMVESRGGRVWVESAPGRGAAFHFTWRAQAA
ncbi:ATP-binding protein [Longimicrobium sp.]|uniref:ATP-binding protein n=1 Tax=Longimicrobium sp. TaxID=2029185 RepID=UPI002E328374|nr:ATP-binding protein [Longimicrobium sp.]HEX6039354.1 ATP-binding protein [Longimicrobium sp.]